MSGSVSHRRASRLPRRMATVVSGLADLSDSALATSAFAIASGNAEAGAEVGWSNGGCMVANVMSTGHERSHAQGPDA